MIWKILSIKLLQPFWSKFHTAILYAQGYGLGACVQSSGEKKVFRKIVRNHNSRQPFILFDCGANAGQYLISIKPYLPENYHIYAFEPHRNTFETLQKNLSHMPGVSLFQLAVDKESGEKTLYLSDRDSRHNSLYQRHMEHHQPDYVLNIQQTVKTISIDEFCSQHHIDYISFLKLDIEGNELNALLGAQQMLKTQRIHIIQFEFGTCMVDSKVFMKDIFSLLGSSFRIYRILPTSLYHLQKYHEKLEVFLTTNYLAVSNRIPIKI